MLRLRTRAGRPQLAFGRGHLGRGFWGRRCVLGGGILAVVEGEWEMGLVGGTLCCVVD